MRMQYALSLVSLLACAILHTADKRVELDEKKQPLLSDKKLSTYRICKQKGWFYLKSHEVFVGDHPLSALNLFAKSLNDLDTEAMQFYGPYSGRLTDLWQKTIGSGSIEHVKAFLPILKNARLRLDKNESYELPYQDLSGLATCAECKDENEGLEKAQIIIDFYSPTLDTCDKNCIWKCDSCCQELRKTFIAYGLSKALEKAVEKGRSSNTINYFLAKHDAFVTREAVLFSREKKDQELAKRLTIERARQMTSGRKNNYTLLSEFKCLQEVPADPCVYPKIIAEPVLSNRKPGYSSSNPYGALCSKNA